MWRLLVYKITHPFYSVAVIAQIVTTKQVSRILISLCLLLNITHLSAQKSVLKQADVFFAEKRYREAYNTYSQLKESNKTTSINLKMADCNFYTEKYVAALNYYSKCFSDSVYSSLQQYENYALASKLSGKITLAAKIYNSIYENKNDSISKLNANICALFLDAANHTHIVDLDSNYRCISLDASESIDTKAMPSILVWKMGDSTTLWGNQIRHCYEKDGKYKVELIVKDAKTGVMRDSDTSLIININTQHVNFVAPPTGKIYLPVKFHVTDTSIVNGNQLLEYYWQMDDGTSYFKKNISHKYLTTGLFYPKLILVARNPQSGKLSVYGSKRAIQIVNTVVPFNDTPIYHTDYEKKK
jgi:tetratricopeptide (TPR) repeat protein